MPEKIVPYFVGDDIAQARHYVTETPKSEYYGGAHLRRSQANGLSPEFLAVVLARGEMIGSHNIERLLAEERMYFQSKATGKRE